jgi:hypothetical protein
VDVSSSELLQKVRAGGRVSPRVAATVLVVGVLCYARPAAAQLSHPLWGLSATFTPTWNTPDYQKVLFQADRVALSGSEFTVGLFRGDQLKPDWGVSFVRRSFKPGGLLARGDQTTTVVDAQLEGVEIYRSIPIVTIRDRVQLGISGGVGVGVMRGSVTQTALGEPAVPEPAKDLITFNHRVSPVVPLARLELAGTYVATPQIRIRITGGFAFPGERRVVVGLLYFFRSY